MPGLTVRPTASAFLLCMLAACGDRSESNPLATSDPDLAKGPPALPTSDVGGPYEGVVGEPVRFDGTGSSHPNSSHLTYTWYFGDGTRASGPTPTHTFWAADTYSVLLLVTANGRQRSVSRTTVEIAPVVLVSDDFSRTLATAWGDADVGGAWRLSSDDGSEFSVNGSAGRIEKADHLPRNAVATGGYWRDVAGIASFSIDRAPDAASFYTVQVYARRDDSPGKGDGNYYYRFRVRAHHSGEMDIRLGKAVDGTKILLGSSSTPIPVAWTPGAKYWIRWECIGASPGTRLRMRVWRDGTDEPSDWQIDTTHDEPALDFPGTTGFRVSGPNTGQLTWPVAFSLDDLRYLGI